MNRFFRPALSVSAAFVLLAGQDARAQQVTLVPGLGSLSFPNSGAPAAQQDFLRGVLLLHSFEYGTAAEAFRRAQQADPSFAMAYWGEAMTYTHPVWNQKDAAAALGALARLAPTSAERLAKTGTEREQGFLQAVETLYGQGQKASLDTLYSAEMGALAAQYPKDVEVQTFYALSLLGLSQGDRDVPTYMEAGTIALAAFQANPDHPGGAHYTIHSFDDPTHAILAMQAARTYAQIAPDAAHAQHMTTHIFLARGMWDDVVEINIQADAVTDRARAANNLPPTNCGHYNQWLMYGYQQQGRYDAADALLMGCFRQVHDERLPLAQRRTAARSYVTMRSSNLADTRRWDGKPASSEMDASSLSVGSQLAQAWGTGLAALHRGDRATAERMHEVLVKDGGLDGETYAPVWEGTLHALLLQEGGDAPGALIAAKAAADYEASLPVDFGPPIAYKPARELEGELLLANGRAEDAMAAFEMALARTPNRILALAGYARAASAAGRTAVAQRSYATLAELLAQADGDMKEAQEVRQGLYQQARR